MNSIKNAIVKLFKDDIKVLGRWNIEYCNIKMNNKIDLSNEDHCGPCGQYSLYTLQHNKNKNTIKEINKKYINE